MIRTPPKTARPSKRVKLTNVSNRVPRAPRFSRLSLGKTGFPATLAFTHKFTSFVSTWQGATAPFYVDYSTNGLFSIGGLQPYYFDQLAALYRVYTVMGATMKVTFTTADGMGGALVHDDTNPPSNLRVVAEDPTSQVRLLQTAATIAPIYIKWNRGDAFSGDLSGITSSGTNTSVPSEQEYFRVFQNITASGVKALVEIEYNTVWSDRINVPIS